jgi:hypothetical protein
MLLAASVMVYGKYDGTSLSCSRGEMQCRESAIAPDFQQGSNFGASHCPLIELNGFVYRQEALYVLKVCRAHGRLP